MLVDAQLAQEGVGGCKSLRQFRGRDLLVQHQFGKMLCLRVVLGGAVLDVLFEIWPGGVVAGPKLESGAGIHFFLLVVVHKVIVLHRPSDVLFLERIHVPPWRGHDKGHVHPFPILIGCFYGALKILEASVSVHVREIITK